MNSSVPTPASTEEVQLLSRVNLYRLKPPLQRRISNRISGMCYFIGTFLILFLHTIYLFQAIIFPGSSSCVFWYPAFWLNWQNGQFRFKFKFNFFSFFSDSWRLSLIWNVHVFYSRQLILSVSDYRSSLSAKDAIRWYCNYSNGRSCHVPNRLNLGGGREFRRT